MGIEHDDSDQTEDLTLRFIVVYRPDKTVAYMCGEDDADRVKDEITLDRKALGIKGKYKIEKLTFLEANAKGLLGDGPVSV